MHSKRNSLELPLHHVGVDPQPLRAGSLRCGGGAQDKPIFKNSSHLGVECEFRRTGPGVEESRLEACLCEVDPDKYEGRGCVWMVWRLPGPTRRFPSKCHYASLRPGPAADQWIIYHKTAMTLLPQPPESTRLYKIAKGQCMTLVQLATMCETQMGTMRIMSWEDYNKFRGAEAPTFSPRQVLRNYDEMTPSKFQSYVIKLDTRFRGDRTLNQGKRPPATEEEFVHMQSRSLMQLRKQITEDQVTGESLLVPCDRQLEISDFVINDETVSCWWYDAEKHHKLPLDFFEAYGRARDERRTLIFYGDSGKGKTPLACSLTAVVAREAGLDSFVLVSSPDMLRSAVERNLLRDERPLLLDELQLNACSVGAQGGGVDTLKHLLGLSPDLAATIKCRYHDVKVPAETFRVITVQDLLKLDKDLERMARDIRTPNLMEGLAGSWVPAALDKLYDADTRALLKRCIMVEVKQSCVKTEVRDRRKIGSQRAASLAEGLRALHSKP